MSNPKDVELRKRLKKLKDYKDVGRNLLSPLQGFHPIPPNNNNNDNSDDNYDDLPPTDSYFPYSSLMPPANYLPQVPFLTPPQTPFDSSTVELEKIEENSNYEIHLDEDLIDLFLEADKFIKKN